MECKCSDARWRNIPPHTKSITANTIRPSTHCCTCLLHTIVVQWWSLNSFRIFSEGAVLASYVYVYNNYRIVTLPWNSVFTWFFALLAVDFAYYWVHRCSHGKWTFQKRCHWLYWDVIHCSLFHAFPRNEPSMGWPPSASQLRILQPYDCFAAVRPAGVLRSRESCRHHVHANHLECL